MAAKIWNVRMRVRRGQQGDLKCSRPRQSRGVGNNF